MEARLYYTSLEAAELADHKTMKIKARCTKKTETQLSDMYTYM